MKIDHIAVYTNQLEKMKDFYVKFFGGIAGKIYQNPAKGFYSYFIRFDDHCRLELMSKESIQTLEAIKSETIGFTHLAFSVGSKEAVDKIMAWLEIEGVQILGKARFTGDGYYEGLVCDLEGNRIEIAI